MAAAEQQRSECDGLSDSRPAVVDGGRLIYRYLLLQHQIFGAFSIVKYFLIGH